VTGTVVVGIGDVLLLDGRGGQQVRVGSPRQRAAAPAASAAERLGERGPERAAHGAVDEEVGRVVVLPVVSK